MPIDIGLHGAASLAARALSHGGQRLTLGSSEWDVSGDCEASTVVEIRGRSFRGTRNIPEWGCTTFQGAVRRDPNPHTIFLHVRCGRCAKCRRLRRRIWTARAKWEMEHSVRTWLVTLTAHPENHFIYQTRARKRCRERGYIYDQLSDEEKFREVCREMGSELTKYIKRVRKESGAKLRMMWVFEAHKSGAPHIHGLVHEVDHPVTWRILNRQWKDGFSHMVLLTDPTKSGYAAKYLSKDALNRVRASRWYGQEKKRPQVIARPIGQRDYSKVVFSDVDDYTGSAHSVRRSSSETAESCVHEAIEPGFE